MKQKEIPLTTEQEARWLTLFKGIYKLDRWKRKKELTSDQYSLVLRQYVADYTYIKYHTEYVKELEKTKINI